MTGHFTGTTRKKKMESQKAASEEVRLQTTAKNRQRPSQDGYLPSLLWYQIYTACWQLAHAWKI